MYYVKYSVILCFIFTYITAIMDKCSKLFSLILCSLILAFLFTSTPIFKFKIFESTHSNLIRIKDFNILNYKIECSSPWGRGRDTTATMKVSYNYKYNDKSYEAEFIDFYSTYKLFFFESCGVLREKNYKIWQKIIEEKSIQLLVEKNSPKNSKLFITNQNPNIRFSWLSIFLAEMQGLIIAAIVISICFSIYMLLFRK